MKRFVRSVLRTGSGRQKAVWKYAYLWPSIYLG
ncbi:hypothetical protein FHW73_000916 [Luteimonas sp. RC10]|nr:hypothetical protein [Luteimonas sp. RC10]